MSCGERKQTPASDERPWSQRRLGRLAGVFLSKGALAVGLFAAGLVWGGGMGGEKRWGESSTGFLAPLGGEDPRIVLRQGLGADKQ